MAYNWNAIQQQAQAGLRPQQPGLGQQFAEKAANKVATDQIAKLGLEAAGTAAAGPLGGVAGSVAGELAGPLASQLVGRLFNKGGAVYKQGGGYQYFDDAGASVTPEQIRSFHEEWYGGPGSTEGIDTHALAQDLASEDGFSFEKLPEKEKKEYVKKVAEKTAPTVAPPTYSAPRSKASAKWNIPLGEFLGGEWSTSGHYSDMDRGKDPFGAFLKGTWKFDEGGKVPSIWDKAKAAAKHAWKNDNLKKGEGRWKKAKPEYKAIGGMTAGPLGMSDMKVLGKDKDISKVKIKKNDGTNTEEVELSYHAPLAAKPKPTGE